MDLTKFFIKNVMFPVEDFILHKSETVKSLNKGINDPYRPYVENRAERNKKLCSILKYAVEKVPYYKGVCEERKIKFHEETIEEDIKQFPMLTKEIIRREGKKLFSQEEIPFIINTSGGSTGEPVKLRQSQKFLFTNAGLVFLSYGGYEMGEKVMVVWGDEREITRRGMNVKSLISNKLIYRTRTLNSFSMNEEHMADFVCQINSWKPSVIRGYVQSMYELSLYIKRNNKKITANLKAVIVSAGTLFPEWRNLIEKIFHCKCINQYGSREVSGIAISCLRDNRLHVNMAGNYVEIIDDTGNRVENSVDGKIVVTNLDNYAMPLIRYEIGDIGALSASYDCACGRHTQMLEHVKGRTVNVFSTIDGKRVDGEYFTHLFYGKEWVRQFQVVQEDLLNVCIYYTTVGNLEPNKTELYEIEKKVKIVMTDKCRVMFFKTDRIVPSPSGKFLYTISKVTGKIP